MVKGGWDGLRIRPLSCNLRHMASNVICSEEWPYLVHVIIMMVI